MNNRIGAEDELMYEKRAREVSASLSYPFRCEMMHHWALVFLQDNVMSLLFSFVATVIFLTSYDGCIGRSCVLKLRDGWEY